MGIKVLERNKATVPPDSYGQRFYLHFQQAIKGGAIPFLPKDDIAGDTANRTPQTPDKGPGLRDCSEERDEVQVFFSCKSDEKLPSRVGSPNSDEKISQR